MKTNFEYFVVLAEMRTGSNFLESNINVFDDLSCHGEAFNPHFIGYPNTPDLLGVTQAEREADPMRLITAFKEAPNLNGFRFFHDHDARVIETVLSDPKCAKIILTRNPVESYVSWKIAEATGQWKLTNVTHHKSAKIKFSPQDFARFLDRLKAFQMRVLHRLQETGQTAFYIGYEDIRDVDVMNGMAKFLGAETRLDALSKSLKKQNPSPLLEKVSNPDEMQDALQTVDHFGLSRTPNFEPRRGASVGNYITAGDVPLLFMPITSGPNKAVRTWLEGIAEAPLSAQMTQKVLRQWKRRTQGHRSFTVVRHPLVRAHAAFCRVILGTGKGSFPKIRDTLKRVHKVPIPAEGAPYDRAAHRAAFLGFLHFLKANLSGQTAVRIDAAWASQGSILQGFSAFAAPDLILREETLASDLEYLAFRAERESPALRSEAADVPFTLEDVYDPEIEAAAQDAYQRDYMVFGYGAWREG